MRVRKAVIPAAGLGTRLLPATKAVPKEMLPIVNKPAIQWIVEECAAAGIELVILINGRYKGALEDHFDVSYEVEDRLRADGKDELLERIDSLCDVVEVVSRRQHRPLGLGHAVLCGRSMVGEDEPFAVLLPDDIVDARNVRKNATAQLIEVHEATGCGALSVVEVPDEDTSRYGILAGQPDPGRPEWVKADRMVEKPEPGTAPSNLGIVGRYVLPGKIFSYLAETKPGRGGEIQLTDALVQLMESDGVYGRILEGDRYDTGSVAGLIEANLGLAMHRPKLRAQLAPFLRRMLERYEA